MRRFCARWRLRDESAVDELSRLLGTIGCRPAPSGVCDEHALFFYRELSPSFRCVYGLSRMWPGVDGLMCGDLSVALLSKSVHDFTQLDDAWFTATRVDAFRLGFETCLAARLSHLKWAESEEPNAQAWPMSVDGVRALFADYLRLIDCHLVALKDDASLLRLLECCLAYSKPPWVLSDPPGWPFLAEQARRLRLKLE